MATFTITVQDKTNLPPDQIGDLSLTLEYSVPYTFTEDDFTINTNPQYSDPENDAPLKLKITDYPSDNSNQLLLNNIEVSENDEIDFTDIINGNLIFQSDSSIISENTFSFNFDIADSGSETYSGLEGLVLITVNEQVNLPPSQIGDGEVTIDDDQILTFTESMFTDTTPEYSDPESDPPSKLKIVSLPSTGEIRLNNVPIMINQIIDFSDINASKLKYFPDDVTTTSLENFEFQIADSGSNNFIG